MKINSYFLAYSLHILCAICLIEYTNATKTQMFSNVDKMVHELKKQIDANKPDEVKELYTKLQEEVKKLNDQAKLNEGLACNESGEERCGGGYTSFYMTLQNYLAPIKERSTYDKLNSMLHN